MPETTEQSFEELPEELKQQLKGKPVNTVVFSLKHDLAVQNNGKTFTVTKISDITKETALESRSTPRKRKAFALTPQGFEQNNVFLNVLQPESYFSPQRYKAKMITQTIVKGKLGILTFNDNGDIINRTVLQPNGVEKIVHGNHYYCVIALEPDTALLEESFGKFDPSDKQFAPWAPKENTPKALAFLEKARREFEK